MSSSVSTPNGFVVVTHVYPQQSCSAVPAPYAMPKVSSLLGKFLKGEPKVLGTVQIMIAAVTMLFGIVLTVHANSVTVYSGILFWGPLCYISSGALCVVANNKLNGCLVNGALVLNIISTIFAGIAVILFSLDFAIGSSNYYCNARLTSNDYYFCQGLRDLYQNRSHGILGVLLLLSILEFTICIYVSAFACNAVCYNPTHQEVYMPHASTQVNNVTSGNVLIPAPNTYETILSPSVGQHELGSFNANDTSKQTEKPPGYVEVFP